MERSVVLALGVCSAVWLAGCGLSVPASNATPAPKVQAEDVAASSDAHPVSHWVENPEYRHWSQFPPGTTVVREKQVRSDGGSVQVTTTLRLLEKRSDRLTVESQVRVVRDGELLPSNPPQPLVYQARFPLPSGMNAAAFELPSLKARPVGQEMQKAGEREFLAEVFTWQEINETGPMQVKYWRHDQVPGRMVRQEIHGPNHDSVEQVTQIVLPLTDANRP